MENVFHKIKANLYPNFLTEDPNDYSARVISERTLNVKQICREAVTRGGAQVNETTMEHHVNLFMKEMAYQLCDGYSINTGYFTAGTQIRGVFNSATEQFSQEKHAILFQMNQGELLRKELSNVAVVIDKVGDSSINITEVIDVKSGTVNDLLTPNKNLIIKGFKIKVSGSNPANGVFFINTTTNESIRVESDEFVSNNPSEVIVVIPVLAAGTYKLQMTTQFGGTIELKESRSKVYDPVFTVL